MQLASYFDRIGFEGVARPDFETLQALHRAHLNAVPFENLDVQLHRPVVIGVESVFDKIVGRRRGGWCYEMNGLMGWALQEIGFDVVRLAGGVMRERVGDGQIGNHLCLLVSLDQPFLVDVGFGGSLAEPLLLRPGERFDPPFRVSLSDAGEGYWRYTELAHGAPFTFDFRTSAADETLLAAKCRFLQTDPSSPFVQNLVAQRRAGSRHLTLRGRVLTTTRPDGEDRIILASPDELVSTLHNSFGLDAPEAATLWPVICARHDAVFSAKNQR